MLKLKTLTVGDKTYQVWDPEAARVDDSAVGEQVWSSQKLVETFCPLQTARGGEVKLQPLPGSPLQISADIRFSQTGSGEPGYENVRPITGRSNVTITVSGAEENAQHTVELGQEIYGGVLECTTGLLTVTHKLVTFTGEESGWRQEGTSAIIHYSFFNDASVGTSNALTGWCSHVQTDSSGVLRKAALRKDWKNGYAYISAPAQEWGLPDNTVAAWAAYLKEQAAAGTPVQVVYRLENPLTVQLAPVQIPALAGENTLSCDSGESTVTYRADPRFLLEKLCIDSNEVKQDV